MHKYFRLASVQEERVPAAPIMKSNGDVKDDTRKTVLQDIQAMVPNHEARLHSVEVCKVLILQF